MASEVGAHALSRMFSDVQHRERIPDIARQIREAPSPRILFLGNSLTRRGVSVDSFVDQLERDGVTAGGVWKACPDDTTLRHWHYVFEKHFSRPPPAQTPDYVIVTFIADALSDQVAPRTRRLALNVQGSGQLGEVLRHDVGSLDDACYFLAAHSFNSIAYQPEMKDGILHRIIPSYRSETQRLNGVQRDYRARASGTEAAREEDCQATYRELRQFLEMLRANACHGVFCLMPLPGEQSLDPRLVETIESAGMTFADLRSLRARTKGHYPDGLHMDDVAADIYSRAVANALAEVIRKSHRSPNNE